VTGVPAEQQVAHAAHVHSGRIVRVVAHRHRHAPHHPLVSGELDVVQDARPHQRQHRTDAVIGNHAGAAHFDDPVAGGVEAGEVEFGGGVVAAGGGDLVRRQHPVTADELFGQLVADQQVIAVLIEPVGVQTGSVIGDLEAGFGG